MRYAPNHTSVIGEESFYCDRRRLLGRAADASESADAAPPGRARMLAPTCKHLPQFFRHVGSPESENRVSRMTYELELLGIDARGFAQLMGEIQSTSVWKIQSSTATQRMAEETIRCYGSVEAARLKIAWNSSLKHNDHDLEFKQRRENDWWRCLDPADTDWPPPPGPPPALRDGWTDDDYVDTRLQRGLKGRLLEQNAVP